MMGIAKFLMLKEAGLRIDFDDPRDSYLIKGKFVRAENVEGKKEMIALSMEFDETLVPMGFKIRLNDYLNTVRADSRVGGPSAEAPVEDKKSDTGADGGKSAGDKESGADTAGGKTAAGEKPLGGGKSAGDKKSGADAGGGKSADSGKSGTAKGPHDG
jgi:hypothetical protein